MLSLKLVSLMALGAAALPSTSVPLDDPAVKTAIDTVLSDVKAELARHDFGSDASSAIERRQSNGCVGGNFTECWEFLNDVCAEACPSASIIQLQVCVATCITGSQSFCARECTR
ncbi:hypothetical protein QBC34DRAFT_76604 [Podospora aff. communis PSN243]|uniref:Uncharacterized protein n=1 Tax=Podospora aff. communis PSN243 TaxID=3040156 RepID=A0AAV9GP22_9PEZI|nr:hypothetical protein QBC34DRAFT_76604 [Podospora aff. communis PSN243]